jgi:hypothetical protein
MPEQCKGVVALSDNAKARAQDDFDAICMDEDCPQKNVVDSTTRRRLLAALHPDKNGDLLHTNNKRTIET